MSRCAWVDCDPSGQHEHADRYRWHRSVEGAVDEHLVIDVNAQGVASISEAALAQLLLEAGWERVPDSDATFATPGDTREFAPCTGEPECDSDFHMLCCPALKPAQEDE